MQRETNYKTVIVALDGVEQTYKNNIMGNFNTFSDRFETKEQALNALTMAIKDIKAYAAITEMDLFTLIGVGMELLIEDAAFELTEKAR